MPGRQMRLRIVGSLLILLGSVLLMSVPAQAEARYRVMVVSSYSPEYHWAEEINDGIRTVLSDKAELHFFSLQTKKDLPGAPARAEQLYQRYLELQPDGVIAADDYAQSLFVQPYLANRVTTPVIFCGVNGDPARYGFPASNVSGVVERVHFAETLAFSRQLDPSITSFAFMSHNSLTTDLVIRQLQSELAAGQLSLSNVAVLRPETLAEAIAMARDYRDKTDCLLLGNLEGLTDEQGRLLSDAEAMPPVFKAFGKATSSTNAQGVYSGALSAVVKSGHEQGEKAALMLLEALQGTPVAQLPVQQNYRGIRLINVDTLKKLGIEPSPLVLRGAKLIKSSHPED